MASFTYSVTGSWASVQAGPKDLNLSNTSIMNMEYQTAASLPAETSNGITLMPKEVHPVKVATGENLYMRSRGTITAKIATAIDVV